jgi:hypothetical protein
MAGGEHDAEVGTGRLGEEGDRGGRHDTNVEYVDSGAREPCDDSRRQELP